MFKSVIHLYLSFKCYALDAYTLKIYLFCHQNKYICELSHKLIN